MCLLSLMSSAQLEGTARPDLSTTTLEGTMRSDILVVEQQRSQGAVYKEETIIGNGAYGTVYKARDINNPSTYVAIKKVRIPLNEDGVPVSILREISLIRQLDKFQHPNIVRFLDVCNGPRQGLDQSLVLFLVFEFVDRDLGKYIQTVSVEELTLYKIKDITFQILRGVDFLHSQRILHRDLKPQNLLITRSGQVKLADFGLAKVYDFSMRLTNVVVTLWYRAPEVLVGASYASPVDMWSIGCIFAELYRRRPLCPGTSERDQCEKIFDVLGTPSVDDWPRDSKIMPTTFLPRPARNLESLVPGLCPRAEDLLSKLLAFNAEKRISAMDALNHPYFEGLMVTEPSVVEIKDLGRVGVVPQQQQPLQQQKEQQPSVPSPIITNTTPTTTTNNNKSSNNLSNDPSLTI